VKLVHIFGLITKKFVTMHGNMNEKFWNLLFYAAKTRWNEGSSSKNSQTLNKSYTSPLGHKHNALTTKGMTSILLLNSSTVRTETTWNGQLNEIEIFCYKRQQLHAYNLQSIKTGQKRNSFRLFQHLVTSFLMCTLHQILFGWSNQDVWEGRGTWQLFLVEILK